MPDEDAMLLRNFYSEFREFRGESRTRDERFDEILSQHHVTLYGDGNGRPGLRVRTDRIEQRHETLAQALNEKSKRHETHFWTIWAAVLASIGGAIASWFSKPQ